MKKKVLFTSVKYVFDIRVSNCFIYKNIFFIAIYIFFKNWLKNKYRNQLQWWKLSFYGAFRSWLKIIIIPLLLAFYQLKMIYMKAAGQVKRKEATMRSPLYSHISETLHGLPTIRAYDLESHFMKNINDLISNIIKLFL